MDLAWVHKKNGFIVALILTITTLAGVIVILWKSSNKKDALITELAKESEKVPDTGDWIHPTEQRFIMDVAFNYLVAKLF